MKKLLSISILFVLLLTACASATPELATQPFVIGAIPDQDPEMLQRRFGLLSEYLETELGVPVEYKPVTDYAASVTAFRVGDLDMVWFGGLTGVQARLQVDGAQALVQRDMDGNFHSLFIANTDSGVETFEDIAGLKSLKGKTFTFGSESSTSGRLMPQYYLAQADVSLDDFKGEAGFSGSHDATIDLVEAGTYETGALNENVWNSRVEAGEVDLEKVRVIWRTPPFHDYHWVIRPDVVGRYGDDFTDQVTDAFISLDINNPDHAEILELFNAEKFVVTENGNYVEIEAIGRELGKIN